jgi:hypothetical protein
MQLNTISSSVLLCFEIYHVCLCIEKMPSGPKKQEKSEIELEMKSVATDLLWNAFTIKHIMYGFDEQKTRSRKQKIWFVLFSKTCYITILSCHASALYLQKFEKRKKWRFKKLKLFESKQAWTKVGLRKENISNFRSKYWNYYFKNSDILQISSQNAKNH